MSTITQFDTEQTWKDFAAQIPRNIIANISFFLISVITGILLVPYFLSTLGIAAYGLIPLATSITGYVAIVVQSLNTAVSRFLTIDLRQKDFASANRTFNTAFFGLSAIILLMVPVILLISWYVPFIFNVPPEQENDAFLLFLGISAAFLIRSWSGNFTVQLFAYNRLDLQNLVNLTDLFVRIGLIIVSFNLLGPDLALIGGASLAAAVIASGVSIILARRICPHLRISIVSFDRSKVRDLCGSGGWIFLDSIGTLFLFQIDLIIVNLLFGATSAGEYAIAMQWGSTLQIIAATLVGVLVPIIFSYYAMKHTTILIQITKSAVKMMGLAMALPVGLICGFAPLLLTLWVGAEYANLAPLLVLLTAHLVVNMSVLPLFPINVAHNQLRIPGLMTLIFGITNLILAIIIPLVTGWGYYGVALAGVITLTFRHVLFVPWYAAKILKIRITIYLRSFIPGTIAMLCIGGTAAVIIFFTNLHSLFMLLIAGTCITLIYGAIVLYFGLTHDEKQFLNQICRKDFFNLNKSSNNND